MVMEKGHIQQGQFHDLGKKLIGKIHSQIGMDSSGRRKSWSQVLELTKCQCPMWTLVKQDEGKQMLTNCQHYSNTKADQVSARCHRGKRGGRAGEKGGVNHQRPQAAPSTHVHRCPSHSLIPKWPHIDRIKVFIKPDMPIQGVLCYIPLPG